MRSKKFIRTDIQLKLTLWFAFLSVFALVFQFLVMLNTMTSIPLDASNFANRQELFMDGALKTLWISLGVILPLTIAVGVLTTFRIAGPIHRFTKFLEETKNGGKPADCAVRANDELHDFCALINDATAPLRKRSEDSDDKDRLAA